MEEVSGSMSNPNYVKEQLQRVVGFTVAAIDVSVDGYPVMILTKGKRFRAVFILSDEEGNDGGAVIVKEGE